MTIARRAEPSASEAEGHPLVEARRAVNDVSAGLRSEPGRAERGETILTIKTRSPKGDRIPAPPQGVALGRVEAPLGGLRNGGSAPS